MDLLAESCLETKSKTGQSAVWVPCRERKRNDMTIRKLGLSLVAVLVIGALMASSAFGAVETVGAKWFTGSSPTELTGSKSITAKMIEDPGLGVLSKFNTEIGGLPVELTSTEIECSGCTIENKEVTSKPGKVAFGSGKIVFKNVTAMLPENCTVKSEAGVAGEVGTKALNIHGDFMDTNTENKHDFVEFVPQAGAGTTFAQFKLSGAGCSAIAGTYNVTGTVFGESVNNTGVGAAEQGLILGSAVQATTGSELKVGVKSATLTGRASFSIGGEAFTVRTAPTWSAGTWPAGSYVEKPAGSNVCYQTPSATAAEPPNAPWVHLGEC
jgi:hypothetical protein